MTREVRITVPVREKDIQRAILDYLQVRGIFAFRANTGAARYEGKNGPRFVRYGFPGVADILGILPNWIYVNGKGTPGLVPFKPSPTSMPPEVGRFLAIEVKRGIQRQSADQKAFQEAVERSGGLYILAYKTEDVIAALG